MSEQHSPDQPFGEPSDGVAGNQPTAEQLDELLADAATLASQLSDEVGSDEALDSPAKTSSGDAASAKNAVPMDTDLDAELQELERLVAQTGDELDSDSNAFDDDGSDSEQTDASSPAPPKAREDAEIPNFMSEFTDSQDGADVSLDDPSDPNPDCPPPPVAPAAQRPVSSAVKMEKPGVVGTAKVGVVGNIAPPEAEADVQAEEVLPRTNRLEEWREKLVRLVEPLASRLSTPSLTWCNRLVSCLETLDRPFSKIGNVPRRLIGWLAIATIGVTLIVSLGILI